MNRFNIGDTVKINVDSRYDNMIGIIKSFD